MVGSSRMAIPQGLGQATPGTSSPSAHSERADPLSQPFQSLSIDSPRHDQPSSPAAQSDSFPRPPSEVLETPTEFLEQWQRLVRREAQRRGLRLREAASYSYMPGFVAPPARHAYPWVNQPRPRPVNQGGLNPMVPIRGPLEWREGRWIELGPRDNPRQQGPRRNAQRGPRLDNMDDGRPDAKEGSDLMVKLDCKICMSQLVDTVIIPCGHAVLCQWCADLQFPPSASDPTRPSGQAQCPICRAQVKQKIRIYLT